MDPVLIVGIMLGFMLVLIILGMPIAFSMGLAGSLGLVILVDWQTLLYSVGSFPVSRIASINWAALPLYILLGNLVASSGVATDAYEMAHKWFSKLKGGLVLVTIFASGLIAATTGGASTSIAIMGKIAVPEMEKLGYDKSLAAGATASCGPLGTLIPPSIAFVIIGILTQLSIGKLFISGILPGILSVAVFMLMVYIRCTLNPKLAPVGIGYSWKERVASLPKVWGVIVIFFVIIGGLYTGVATATEVAALGCLVGLIMVILAISAKKSSWKQLSGAVIDTIGISAMIFAFFVGAGIFSLFVTLSGILQETVVFIQGLGLPTVAVLIAVVIVYLILGMFFDPTSMLMVTVPIFFPVLVGGLGVDAIWFSVITVIMVEVSSLTPPVGMAVFVMHGVYPKVPVTEIFRGCQWFVLANMVVVAILFVFPQIATWLPSIME